MVFGEKENKSRVAKVVIRHCRIQIYEFDPSFSNPVYLVRVGSSSIVKYIQI
jgi:hypothetical protein